jgi:hypothetical protein
MQGTRHSTRVLMNAETESSETKRPELKSRLRLSDLMRMEMHAHCSVRHPGSRSVGTESGEVHVRVSIADSVWYVVLEP